MTPDLPTVDTLEEQFHEERLKQIEMSIDHLGHELGQLTRAVETLTKNLRETQQFAIKLGVSHQRISERVNSWPVIKIRDDRNLE